METSIDKKNLKRHSSKKIPPCSGIGVCHRSYSRMVRLFVVIHACIIGTDVVKDTALLTLLKQLFNII